MDETSQFEKAPNKTSEVSGEAIKKAAEWSAAMSKGVPEFAGPKMLGGTGADTMRKTMEMGARIGEATFGNANEENEFYGEAKDEDGNESIDGELENEELGEERSAAKVLEEAVEKYGIESAFQKLKSFDESGSENPVEDLYTYMGIGTAYESERPVGDDGVNVKHEISPDRAAEELAAIRNMKELISEVEGADPRYEELRQGAKATGKGYFEYAVSSFGVHGLAELFQVLEAQKEQPTIEEDKEVEKEAREAELEKRMNSTERLNPEITRGNAA